MENYQLLEGNLAGDHRSILIFIEIKAFFFFFFCYLYALEEEEFQGFARNLRCNTFLLFNVEQVNVMPQFPWP